MLRLNELDEVREELDKRDYGTWVHAALQRFHDEFKSLLEHERDVAEAALRRISAEVFAGALAHDYLAQAWLLRWQAQIPAYIDWQLANEREGWRYSGAETDFGIGVMENLTLRGRIDRIDYQGGDMEVLRVLDYKTQAVAPLRNKLKEPGEDVQLACYAYDLHASEAAFVALDGGKVDAVTPPQDIAELARLNIERLKSVFERMHQGAAMPAHGAESVCGYCEMRGLCRYGQWEAGTGLPIK
jgi:ATP-dependent helicase/nuclease subunit B